MSTENQNQRTRLMLSGPRYLPDNSEWKVFERENPEWDTIEDCLRRMERFLWPCVMLWRSDHTSITNKMSIMGGRGEYYLWFEGNTEYFWYYLDETRRKTEVKIWESDQGLEASEQLLCNDLDLVLTIVQYFIETGERYPQVRWTDDPWRYSAYSPPPASMESQSKLTERHNPEKAITAENAKYLTGLILSGALYPPDNSHWKGFDRVNPEWATIERCIRRMERFLWPGFWLHRNVNLPDEYRLGVMGGRGEYIIYYNTDDGEREWHYLDATRSKTIVQIWESDQGSEVPEQLLCNDVELVLTIVRHFIETGERYPQVQWSNDFEDYI